MSNALIIEKDTQGNKTVVSVAGKISSDNYMELDRVLQSLDYADLDLTLDFGKVEYITSAGLRTLLTARKKLSRERMRIVHAGEEVRNVFDLSGFLAFFDVETDAEEAEPGEDPSFIQMLSYRVKTSPDREIYFMNDSPYTWTDLDNCSQIIASDLSRLGVRRGSHVGILSRNSVNWVLTFLAIQKLGAVAILLNHSLTPEEIRMFSELGDITHLCYGDLTLKTDRAAFGQLIRQNGGLIRRSYDIASSIDFRQRYDELADLDGLFADRREADDPSVMIFTSGTTGKPKGVLSSAHDLMANAKNVKDEVGISENDKSCLFLPLYHIFGIQVGFVLSLLVNIPVYINSSSEDGVLLDTIHRHGCTVFDSVPTKIISMTRSKAFSAEKTASLRSSLLGGSSISEAQLGYLQEKLPGVHFMSVYGMSEIAPISIVAYNDTPEHIVSTVGKPSPGVQVEIRNPATGAVCATGEEGEITVKSENSLVCYYKFDIEKQAIDGEGWIPTGDLGMLCEDGYLKITGRIKDLIIRGGENISPREIEGAITGVDGISDVKVIGVPHELYGEVVAAAVVMAAGAEFDRSRIEDGIRDKLAGFKLPAHYAVYSAFPLLSNGKVDMLRLKKEVARKVADNEAL